MVAWRSPTSRLIQLADSPLEIVFQQATAEQPFAWFLLRGWRRFCPLPAAASAGLEATTSSTRKRAPVGTAKLSILDEKIVDIICWFLLSLISGHFRIDSVGV